MFDKNSSNYGNEFNLKNLGIKVLKIPSIYHYIEITTNILIYNIELMFFILNNNRKLVIKKGESNMDLNIKKVHLKSYNKGLRFNIRLFQKKKTFEEVL